MMGQGNGFVGVVCAVYLIGGVILGALGLVLQLMACQFAKRSWVRVLPLMLGIILWLAMVFYRFMGMDGPLGGMISGLYTVFGGWVHPHDLVAFAMSTLPILVGLVIGYWLGSNQKSAVSNVDEN